MTASRDAADTGLRPTPTLVSWSGGKDSALALHALLSDPSYEVRGLLTTVTDGYERVSMHGVRVELVLQQADAVGLPISFVRIPPAASNEHYEAATIAALLDAHSAGIASVAFGDLFLADVRAYRERLVARAGLDPVFPLWGQSTYELARHFLDTGFKSVLACVDPRQIDPALCGCDFDRPLLAALPPSADPCGENGEFHTFVYDGPIFTRPIDLQRGELVERNGFVFGDLLPSDVPSASSGYRSPSGMPRA